MMVNWFQFDQNNSGGIYNDPAYIVLVAADTAANANDAVTAVGVYFDGVVDGIDCECCGDQWYDVTDADANNIDFAINDFFDGDDFKDVVTTVFITRPRKVDVPYLCILKDGKAAYYNIADFSRINGTHKYKVTLEKINK